MIGRLQLADARHFLQTLATRARRPMLPELAQWASAASASFSGARRGVIITAEQAPANSLAGACRAFAASALEELRLA